MITIKKALAASALTLALGLGGAVANANTIAPFIKENCPVDTANTSGKLAATCVTYAYDPTSSPANAINKNDSEEEVQLVYGASMALFDKDDGPSANDNFYLTGTGFSTINYGTTTEGNFLISNSVFNSFGTIVLVLKGGNEVPTWVMFEIAKASLTAGTGDQAGFWFGIWESGRQGLSHASLYTGNPCSPTDPNCNPPPPDRVPEPGSLALLGLGLLGLGWSQRKSPELG